MQWFHCLQLSARLVSANSLDIFHLYLALLVCNLLYVLHVDGPHVGLQSIHRARLDTGKLVDCKPARAIMHNAGSH